MVIAVVSPLVVRNEIEQPKLMIPGPRPVGQYAKKYGLPIRRKLKSTGSESSLNTVRQWMATCDAEHDCYPSHFTQSRCPAARLIDVQAFGASCPDVRLIETDKVNAGTGKVCHDFLSSFPSKV